METITLTRSTAPRKDQRLVIYNIEGRKGSPQPPAPNCKTTTW